MTIRYAHTNIVAGDWRSLAEFYHEVFDCEPMPPERDYSGDWVARTAGVAVDRITGMHLKLPGFGPDGPTLEIFQYHPEAARPRIAANTPGFSHIAFVVDDVEAMTRKVLAHGGGVVGEHTEMDVAGAGRVILRYMADPEGNIVELQHWTPLPAD